MHTHQQQQQQEQDTGSNSSNDNMQLQQLAGLHLFLLIPHPHLVLHEQAPPGGAREQISKDTKQQVMAASEGNVDTHTMQTDMAAGLHHPHPHLVLHEQAPAGGAREQQATNSK